MRKHAAGLIFFVSIISVFIAAYAVVRTYPIPNIEVVDDSDGRQSKYVCFPDTRGDDIRVTQAIADPLAKSLAFTLANGDSTITEIDLTFYNVSGNGVRFVRDEVVKITPDRWSAGTASGVFKYKTDWLGSKQITDNLYVVARKRRPERAAYELGPFAKENATAVLIAKN